MTRSDMHGASWTSLCGVSVLIAGLAYGCGDSRPKASNGPRADAGRSDAAVANDGSSGEARERACAAVNAAIAAEVDALRVCARPADCGKPLPTLGSCGCSHNAVGHMSADTGRLDALLAEREMYSDVRACAPLGGTCDCPPVGGVTCEAERCAWVNIKPEDRCASLEGTYTSVDELECGLTPSGVGLCHWSLTFMSSTFTWQYSDVGESGSYACENGDVVASTAGDRQYQGTLAEDGSLTFDGVKYTRRP